MHFLGVWVFKQAFVMVLWGLYVVSIELRACRVGGGGLGCNSLSPKQVGKERPDLEDLKGTSRNAQVPVVSAGTHKRMKPNRNQTFNP